MFGLVVRGRGVSGPQEGVQAQGEVCRWWPDGDRDDCRGADLVSPDTGSRVRRPVWPPGGRFADAGGGDTGSAALQA